MKPIAQTGLIPCVYTIGSKHHPAVYDFPGDGPRMFYWPNIAFDSFIDAHEWATHLIAEIYRPVQEQIDNWQLLPGGPQ